MAESNDEKKLDMTGVATVGIGTPLLDAKGVAKVLDVSVKTVQTLVRNGELPVVLIQGRTSRRDYCKCWRFTLGDVRLYIASKRQRLEPPAKKKRGRKPRQEEVE